MRSAGKITSDWVRSARKAWKDISVPKRGVNDVLDAKIHLQSVIDFIDRLAQDILYTKGMFYYPSDQSGWLTQTLRKKSVDELKNTRKILSDGLEWMTRLRKVTDPNTREFGMDQGRMLDFYRDKDPRSPQRAINAAAREELARVMKAADAAFNRKFLATFSRVINKYAPTTGIDLEQDALGPLVYSVGNAKVIFRDFTARNPLDRVPSKQRSPKDYVPGLVKAKQLLESKGLGKLWYGDITISCKDCGGENPLGARFGVGAHYRIRKDDIVVYMDPNRRLPRLLAHEIGHRYYFKFMSQEDRLGFDSWFQTVPATTDYGSTVSSEDFAEVFAGYVMGEDLTSEQKNRFKAFLERGRSRLSFRLANRYLRGR